MSKPLRQRIVFHTLDLEGLSKPVPTVLCPARAERVTVEGCTQCVDFRRVELDDDAAPVLCCANVAASLPADMHTSKVIAALFVPSVCVSPDTPMLALLPYLDRSPPWNIIPVIDREARVLGVIDVDVVSRELKSGLALDVAVGDVMSTCFAMVTPNTRVCDAASQRPDIGFRGVIVVTPLGRLVGLVPEHEFER